MRCIIYVRVSTEEQARHGFSLPAQVEDCCQRATALGYGDAEVEVIREEGVSGDRVDRPGLNRLRDMVASGGVGHVVMYDPDRFARNLSLQLIVTDEILRAGTQLEFVNFQWSDTPEGRLFYSLRGAIAEYEKAKIRERTRRGRERMVKEGKLPADPRLYGYHWNAVGHTFERHPPEFAVLQRIKELTLAGWNCHAIARHLAEVGIPPPRGTHWHPSTIWKLLRNRDYLGTYWTGKRGGFRRSLPLEPAWDETTRSRLIQANARHRGGAPRSSGLLTGLIYCGFCDGEIRLSLRQTGNHRYYTCNRKVRVSYAPGGGRETGCPSPYWSAEQLESSVWHGLLPLLACGPPTSTRSMASEVTVLQAAAHDLARRRERLLSLFLSGRILAPEFDREAQRLDAYQREAQRRKQVMQAPTPVQWHLPQWFDSATHSVRRQLFRAVLHRVTAGPGRSLTMVTALPMRPSRCVNIATGMVE